MEPWETAARYSECGQMFFTPESLTAHEDICRYCQWSHGRRSAKA